MKLQSASMPVVLHEDAFYEYFVPYQHPEARHNVWGGHGLETFGEDIQLVRRLDPEYVWTVVDGESDQWITPGVRYVNRICYLVTKKAHNWLDVDFRVARNARSLTAIGLRRQIRKIKSLMLALRTD